MSSADTSLQNLPPTIVPRVDEDATRLSQKDDTHHQPRAPQRQLGRYRLIQAIGRGGMGIVWLAEDPQLRRQVAIKMIQDARFADPRHQARFRREAEAAARLRHPNFVQVYEVGEDEGCPYVVLEYVPGGNLSQRLRGEPQPPREAAQLLATLARAMQYAHDNNVLHRDLKPGNILLDCRSQMDDLRLEGNPTSSALTSHHTPLTIPKITDFGLAKVLDDQGLTQTGEMMGTPSYVAPEQAWGKSQVRTLGPTVDVYSLGAILYEALTGRPPFRGQTTLDTLEQVGNQEPVPPRRLQPRIPDDLQTITMKCLEKDPRRRYQTAAALADDLERYLEGQPIVARPVTPFERGWKWARRHPTAAALVAVSVLALLTLLVGGLVYNYRLQEAVQRAQENEALAQRQRNRADSGYQAARTAIRNMLEHLEKRRPSGIPQPRELQRVQIEDALQFYQKMANDNDEGDPGIRLDVAEAHFEAARLQQLLGRGDEATANLETALAIVQQLRQEYPKHDVYANREAAFLHYLGTTSKDLADGIAKLQRAIAIWRDLMARLPHVDIFPNELASSLNNLATKYMASRDFGAATKATEEAIALRTKLVEKNNNPGVRADLANSYDFLGLLLTDKPAVAAATFERAYVILDQLVTEHPSEQVLVNFGALCANYSNILGILGRSDEAKRLLDRGIAAVGPLVEREPGHLQMRHVLYSLYGRRAMHHTDRKDFDQALADWSKVVELATGDARFESLRNKAVVAGMAGRYREALELIPQVEGSVHGREAGAWIMLQIVAACANHVRSDNSLNSVEKNTLLDDCAKDALRIVRQLQEQHWLKPEHVNQLRTGLEFIPLRLLPTFQEFLKELEPSKGDPAVNRCALATLVLVVCCTPFVQADDKELAKMTGAWKVVAMETNGAKMPQEQVTALNLQLIIKGDAYEVKVGDMVVDKGTVKIDAKKDPKTVHVTSSMGPNSGKTIPAIYELKDDEFKVCYDLSGAATPKEFKTKEATMLLLLTYKKAK